ncbi:hypothetical protein FRC07_004089 [Ceratobasidium sp. 392]|nr:hypothetical protein FRC07_004089 [Ceratobasidium sp. 392]
MPLVPTNYTRKKKFSISAGLEYVSHVLTGSGTTAPLFKTLHRRSTASSNTSQSMRDAVQQPAATSSEATNSPYNRAPGSLRARFSQRERATWYGFPSRGDNVAVQHTHRPQSLALGSVKPVFGDLIDASGASPPPQVITEASLRIRK